MDSKKKTPDKKMSDKIKSDTEKRIKARGEKDDIMFGLGVFGIVGWSIAIPTLIGIALGIYLDGRRPVNFSWTLTLLFAGIIVGCLNAWHWVKQKSKED